MQFFRRAKLLLFFSGFSRSSYWRRVLIFLASRFPRQPGAAASASCWRTAGLPTSEGTLTTGTGKDFVSAAWAAAASAVPTAAISPAGA